MFKKCSHCGFKNPVDVRDCLFCHRDLPMTRLEVKEARKNLGDLAEGKVAEVGARVAKGEVGEMVSSVKYRFSPIWILRLKLFRLKKRLVDFLWVFGIIGGLVILGILINFLPRLFKGS